MVCTPVLDFGHIWFSVDWNFPVDGRQSMVDYFSDWPRTGYFVPLTMIRKILNRKVWYMN